MGDRVTLICRWSGRRSYCEKKKKSTQQVLQKLIVVQRSNDNWSNKFLVHQIGICFVPLAEHIIQINMTSSFVWDIQQNEKWEKEKQFTTGVNQV